MAEKPASVICIKWGTYYPAIYVNRLYAMVARNISRPIRFVCFTDDSVGIRREVECAPIPPLKKPSIRPIAGWLKLSLLAPELFDLKGPALYLDLDVLVTGSIDCFFDYPGDLCIMKNWNQPRSGKGNSSVFRFEVGGLADLYQRFNDDPDVAGRPYANEQDYLCLTPKEASLRFWPPTWVRSFKKHCVPAAPLRLFKPTSPPMDARIIVFHGYPKMEEAAAGRRLGEPSKHEMPWFWRKAPWITETWSE